MDFIALHVFLVDLSVFSVEEASKLYTPRRCISQTKGMQQWCDDIIDKYGDSALAPFSFFIFSLKR